MIANMIKIMKTLLVMLLIFMALVLAKKAIDWWVPDPYNPFQSISIDDKPSFLTGVKINQLKSNQDECFAVLENSNLIFQKLPDQEKGDSCGFYDVALLKRSDISYGGGITLKCPALVSLAIWEQHDLQPLAEEILQQRVVRVKHFGTYACRNVNNSKSGRRSQHAYANAIDVAGFVLEDGSEVSVLNDWNADTKRGEFLSAIHQSACQYFATVLGPDYNQAHKNHFHFDQGPSSICR